MRRFLPKGVFAGLVMITSHAFSIHFLPERLSTGTAQFTVFLIGDTGEPIANGQDPNLNLLRSQLMVAGKNSAVVFMGDNIYPRGLPDVGSPDRPEAERRITDQLNILKDYPGQVFFVPGNHDWQRSGSKGWQYLKNQEEFIENFLNRGNVFLPDGGCPGPVEVSLSEGITMVILDTQWWLHPWDKPGLESDCEAKDPASVVIQLDDILSRNRHKQVIVAAHHPMYSYGEHGGYSTWKQHIFPLTDLNKSLYIPLPVIGSLYPLYRKLLGDPQDTHHPRNRLMRRSITETLQKYPGLVYADGHEHTLQYLEKGSQGNEPIHFIVSGSGSKRTPVEKGEFSLFADANQGFARLEYEAGGSVTLAYWEPDGTDKGKEVYQKNWTTLLGSPPIKAEQVQQLSFADSTAVVRASEQYNAGRGKTWLLGQNYRREWGQPIRVPVLDISTEKGGLKPLKRGGGLQTKSLRLEAANGKEYVLRSIEKNAEKAVPAPLRQTLAADIVQDQISAGHPYSALVVPPLAQAAGVAHTNPQVVLIPDDSHLGPYQKDFANNLALFEEREADPPATFTGQQTDKSYSTLKVVDKLKEDNDNRVDQHEVLRARLFDMVIADWDRHDDQWRWLAYKPGAGSRVDTSEPPSPGVDTPGVDTPGVDTPGVDTPGVDTPGVDTHHKEGLLFRPVPRDRDQAFFVNEGFLPKLASREWVLPKVQGFDYDFQNVNSFMFNGRYFDRSFLTEPSLAEWKALADSIKNRLTDEVIEKAIRTWPDSIFRLSGPQIIAKLKSHRDKLPRYAEQYYRFLAKEVSVVGSDKREYFEVLRQDDDHTKVTVYKMNKEGEKKEVLYQRVFLTGETREVRLYGQGGDDEFDIGGQVSKGILVRIIGGKGDDKIVDRSSVKGLGKKTFVYDTPKGSEITAGPETRNLTAKGSEVNQYDRTAFKYSYTGPLFPFNYNVDDGIFIGAGVMIRKPGFRKEPFAVTHKIVGNAALRTGAYNFDYEGYFTRAIGKFDLQLNGDVQAPNFVRNFFGLGNESTFDQDVNINYYRVRFRNIALNALLRRNLGGHQQFYFGPVYQNVEVDRTQGRFIDQVSDDRLHPATLFENKQYAGLKVGYVIDNRDSKMMTTRGIYWRNELTALRGVNLASRSLTQLNSDLAFYWTFRLPARISIATRFGGTVNFSDYEFFQASTLSGLSNLRGYRRTRFAGKSSFYNNTEIRLKLFSFRTYLFPAYAGILGFHDVGRVWLEGEKSNVWHNSYGGGIWLAPFNQLVITAIYGISQESKLPLIRVGFFF